MDTSAHPGQGDSGIKVNVSFVDIEHLSATALAGQCRFDGLHSLSFSRVTDMQSRTSPSVPESQKSQPAPHRAGVDRDAGTLAEHLGQQLRTPAAAQIAQRLRRALKQQLQRLQHLIIGLPLRASALQRHQALLTIFFVQRTLAVDS